MIRNLAIRNLMSLFFVLLFLGVGVAGFRHLANLRKPPAARVPQENRLNVEVFKIGSEDIRQILRGFGTAQADREVILSAEVAGTIDRLHQDFEVGLSVMAPRYPAEKTPEHDGEEPLIEGDQLAVIDQERYLGQVNQVDAQIQELEAEKNRIAEEKQNAIDVQKLATKDFELIKADFDRQKELHKSGVLTLAELNRFEVEFQQYKKTKTLADNEVAQARQRATVTERKIDTLIVQKELLQDDLDRTVIRPPFDGFVSETFVELGQYVRPGEPIARITNIDRVEIPVSLTLDDYDKLKPQINRGEKPSVELSLHEGEEHTWTGEVVRIAPEANRETRTITVFVEVENARQSVPLLPGTFVFARISGPVYHSDQNAIIPRDAILSNRVFRVEPGRGIVQEVKIKIQEKLQSIAIVQGELEAGNLLVLTNLDMLAQGLPVEAGQVEHRLPDELNSDEPWKSYWEIVTPSTSTTETRPNPAPRSAQSETIEVTE